MRYFRETAFIKKQLVIFGAISIMVLAFSLPAFALSVLFSHESGLSATADFSIINPTTLKIVLTNTSTGVPINWFDAEGNFTAPYDSASQLLTTIAFDLPGDIAFVKEGSSANMGSSTAINFTKPGDSDVSEEWGYGPAGKGDCCPNEYLYAVNWLSAMTSGVTKFQEGSLGNPPDLDGPDFGLKSSTLSLSVGGVEAIQSQVILTLALSGAIEDLSFLENGVLVEFGSDALFLPGSIEVDTPGGTIPEPGTLLLLGSGLVGLGAMVWRKGWKKAGEKDRS